MSKQLLATVALLAALVSSAWADDVSLVETIYVRPAPPPADDAKILTVHFIDVGGGDRILIDTPTGKKILIDGGYTYSERNKAELEYAAYLDKFLQNDGGSLHRVLSVVRR